MLEGFLNTMKNISPTLVALVISAMTFVGVAPLNVVFAVPPTAAESKGGHLLSTPLPGMVSREAAFRAGIHQLQGHFDAPPKLLGGVQSQDENVMIVEFRATQHGTPVSGLSVTAYDPAGNSHAAVLYDTPDHLAQSLPSLFKRLQQETQADLEKVRPAGGPDFAAFEAAANHVALTQTSFPDGTATIGIAQGFTPTMMNGGRFGATAADGAYANLYIPISVLDPKGSLYQQELRLSGGRPPAIPGQTVIAYDSDPVVDWKQILTERANERGDADPHPQVLSDAPLKADASGFSGKMVAGTMTLHNEPFVFSGILLISPPPAADGGWLLQIAIRGAPVAHAATDMPALIAMQRSEKVDMNAVRDQTMRNIAAISDECSRWLATNQAAGDAARNRVFATSMHNAQIAQDNMDHAANEFIHYINDGAGGGTSMTGALAKSDPQHFHFAPIRQ
ncbi:hypothetical protein IAD21_05824 [Abditibacteriota bacterium]|nr:hypothetical protein IAD21_05824 [Abditibacteriota bacterium]